MSRHANFLMPASQPYSLAEACSILQISSAEHELALNVGHLSQSIANIERPGSAISSSSFFDLFQFALAQVLSVAGIDVMKQGEISNVCVDEVALLLDNGAECSSTDFGEQLFEAIEFRFEFPCGAADNALKQKVILRLTVDTIRCWNDCLRRASSVAADISFSAHFIPELKTGIESLFLRKVGLLSASPY